MPIFMFIALLAPTDVLSRSPALAALCQKVDAMLRHLLPQVDFFRHARSTQFPEVATLATANAACWWPLTALVLLMLSISNHRLVRMNNLRTLSVRTIAASCLVAPALAWLGLYAFFALPGDPGFAFGLTTRSRLGYALLGGFTTIFTAGLIASWPVSMFTLINDIILRRRQHG